MIPDSDSEAGASRAPARRSQGLLILAVASVLVFVSYGGSLKNGFVWDDETLVVNNAYVHDLSRWREYFVKAEAISSEKMIAKTYRPLQTLSLALDQALWKGWAGGFHLTSLLIHLLVCMGVYFLFRDLVGTWPSVLAAWLFAVHPALSEGVLCLAARGGQLAALFGLVCTGLFLRARRPFDAWHAGSLAAAALALLSKEPAIALVALLPICQIALQQPWPVRTRQSLALHAPFVVLAVLYLAIRRHVVGSMETAPYWGGSLLATVQLQAKVFVVYLRLLVFPFHLQGRYSIASLGTFPDAKATIAVLLCLVLCIFGLVGIRKRGRRGLVSLAVVWFFVSLSPVSNLIPVPGSMLGERFLYFTFAGMFPLLVGALDALAWRRHLRIVAIAGLALTVVFVATNVSRTGVWRSNATYFRVLAEQEPEDPVTQIRAAQEEVLSGTPLPAIKRLELAIHASGAREDRAKAHYWYGRALLQAGRPSEAYGQLTRAAEMTGKTPTGLALLIAEAAARSGDLAAARAVLERALSNDVGDDAVWNGLGNVLLMDGDLRGAAARYRQALKLNPRNQEAEINLRKLERRLPVAPGG